MLQMEGDQCSQKREELERNSEKVVDGCRKEKSLSKLAEEDWDAYKCVMDGCNMKNSEKVFMVDEIGKV